MVSTLPIAQWLSTIPMPSPSQPIPRQNPQPKENVTELMDTQEGDRNPGSTEQLPTPDRPGQPQTRRTHDECSTQPPSQ